MLRVPDVLVIKLCAGIVTETVSSMEDTSENNVTDAVIVKEHLLTAIPTTPVSKLSIHG
jgi:hypothetical protein